MEVGSQATPFEHRSYGEELNLCLRYYVNTISIYHLLYNTNQSLANITFPVVMRDSPTYTTSENDGSSALFDLFHAVEPGPWMAYAWKNSYTNSRLTFSCDAEL